ncbi:hypothetical protein A9Q89_02585 [Gammaproteobacteria bacterium 53_120_T64]|nr:hypothetical protein A9Q89_02585 [Gammaproteobacteria bacterium 53_120_T64]
MAQSALFADVLAHQLSFKHCLQLWLAWGQQIVAHSDDDRALLFSLMAQRQGRIEPRVVKRRPKPMPLLMKSREEARAEIRANGHTKKLK